jgi:hypothetical protein
VLQRLRRRLNLTGGAYKHYDDAGATTEMHLMTSHGASCSTLVSWLEIDDNTRNEQLESKMAASAL